MTAIKHGLRRRRIRRIAVAGIAAAAGLLLAACGHSNDDRVSGTEHGAEPSKTATKDAGANTAPGAFNDADVMFAQMMIPHHQQAVEMSELADGRAEDAEIKSLAAAIEKAQDPEIQKMTSWLKGWGKPVPGGSATGMDHSMPGMDHGSASKDGSGMSGMMSGKDMKNLTAAKGRDFDRKFAQMMIGHHNGAIEMANDERKKGRNATAKKLAGDVVTNQSAEVGKLNKILDRL
ncbi:DUF305 domain-containing protein [Streptomyces decoyicus]|uniref:DUF305 domain-containing protein n=1 Tax=Streptomyces decoyicus TaxID=249567 RepID=A0ABZ1FST4_9ACTN|nr:DUF305 domain-containing protein [Streptomyces decoyicus]WSB73561.1 DUF305 domain-containing protein [Streptomyces decoyicus]